MYECLWLPIALEQLADIYIAASLPEQRRMAAGVEAFDAGIAHDPHAFGESRDGRDRVAFQPLLLVWFEIDKQSLRVRVTSVIRYGK